MSVPSLFMIRENKYFNGHYILQSIKISRGNRLISLKDGANIKADKREKMSWLYLTKVIYKTENNLQRIQ